MNPERHRQISRIYNAAQDRPSAERAAFVVEACGGDASVRREVESLLAYDGVAANFLEHPPAGANTIAPMAVEAVIPTGARFGDYEVVEQIGAGGMGEVYLARDLTLQRTIALKFLAPGLTLDSGRVARFRQEARAASALNHPNVCTIHALGETSDGQQFIAMEHIAGQTLRQRLAGHHPPLREALDIAILRIGATAAVVLAAAVAWYVWSSRLPASPPSIVPLTSFPGDEEWPDLSPDGTRVAFKWNGEARDNDDIYVMQIGDAEPHRLTKDPAFDGSPVWSPDGSRIAFLRQHSSGNTIYTISLLGGVEQKLTDIAGYTGKLSWLADNRGLVFPIKRNGSSEYEIVFFDLASGEMHSLLSVQTSVGRPRNPVVSPKGDLLAYSYCANAANANNSSCDPYLRALGADLSPKGEPWRLAVFASRMTGLAWTTDGQALIYGSERDGDSRLWSVPISGAKPERLEFVPAPAGSPAISRLGNRLAYTSFTESEDLWKLHPGGRPEAVGSSTLWDRDAELSPNGQRIAFGSGRSGQPNIWVCDQDGANPVRLTKATGRLQGTPRWSPDGNRIAFDAEGQDGHWDIWVIDATGGLQRQLTLFPEDDNLPSWSRDGKWIYFQSTHTGRVEVWKSPAGGGRSVQVTHNGGGAPREAADGKTLFYKRGRELFAASLTGGAEKRVLESVYNWDYYPVENGVYYIDVVHPFKFELRFLDLATGGTTVLDQVESRGGQGFSVSRDRKTFLDSGENLWTGADLMHIENFR